MTEHANYLQKLLKNLKKVRENKKISQDFLEKKMILGPGWIRRFEEGETIPSIDMLLAILHELGSNLSEIMDGVDDEIEPTEVERYIYAEEKGKDLNIHFRYSSYDAIYKLKNASLKDFEEILVNMRNSLARLATTNSDDRFSKEAIKTNAVASTFLKAVKKWPDANPSDLWWFLVYRAYCDPYNHPARYARLDFSQSWKRTGGWALEEVLVKHYGPYFLSNGIELIIADDFSKQEIVDQLGLEKLVEDRIEADKIDIVIRKAETGQFLGVVHVKASFAERRTDDVPMSIALTRAGYLSPLWTMDCKSSPGVRPQNRGELGAASGKRSAKRKDIEDDGYFTGCFSYNKNTRPTEEKSPSERQVYVCDFNNPDDAFSRFIINKAKTM